MAMYTAYTHWKLTNKAPNVKVIKTFLVVRRRKGVVHRKKSALEYMFP